MKFNVKEGNCSIIRKFNYPATFISLLVRIRECYYINLTVLKSISY